MIDSPVFLVGAERSGTTILRLMLDGHPQISFFEEFEYAVSGLDQLTAGQEWPPIETFQDQLANDRVFQLHGLVIDPDLPYPELVDSFLTQACDTSKPVVGATVHFGIDGLLRVWPDARFIHIVRDPRDVAPSHMRMSFAGNVWFGLDKWLDVEDSWTRIASSLPDERYVEVRFSDLLADCDDVLERICRMLGLEPDPGMLSYPERTEYELPQPSQTSSWRNKLTDEEVQLVEARVGDRLVRAGFEPSGLPPIEISPTRLRYLAIDNKIRRVALRATVSGWPLTLSEIAANKLGTRRQREAIHRRRDARINNQRRRSWTDVSGA